MVVLLVEWSYVRGGLKAGFYCTCISICNNHATKRFV